MRARCAIALALAITCTSVRARAADPPKPQKRALAAGAAVVPGVLLHGAGSFVLGKRTTARRLAIAGGIGALGAVTGLTLVALTGASRRFVAPLAATSVMSVGVFGTSLVSDFYSVLAPEGGAGRPLRVAPRYEKRLGVLAVHDPVFAHRVLVSQRIDARAGAFRISGDGQFAPGSVSRRLRAEGAVRLHGPTPGGPRRARDGSYLDVEVAFTDHAYVRDRFGSLLGEASLRGRYDLVRFDGELRGSFVEGQLGTGLFRDRYATATDGIGDLLLARFAWGMYVGHGGEAVLFYDHRRDGYAGGLKPNGIAAGYFGSVGASGRVYVLERWGVTADVQAGSALMGGIGIAFRSEGP